MGSLNFEHKRRAMTPCRELMMKRCLISRLLIKMILLPAATQHVHNTKGNDEISVSLCLLLFLNKKENRERERKKGKQDYPLNFCTHVNYFFGKGGII